MASESRDPVITDSAVPRLREGMDYGSPLSPLGVMAGLVPAIHVFIA